MKILFVCPDNSCRSQMAEALARELDLEGAHQYASAGIGPTEVSERAISTMRERGIDISAQEAKPLAEVAAGADVVVTLAAELEGELPEGLASARRLHWPVAALASCQGTPQELRCLMAEIRDEIERQLSQLLAELGG